MIDAPPAPVSAQDARAQLAESETARSAVIAAAVAGHDPAPTGAELAAADAAVTVARHRLRGAQDREHTGATSHADRVAAEIAEGYAEQDAARAAARAERVATGSPSLSDPSVRIDHTARRVSS